VELENKIFPREETYRILTTVLIEKKPLPPAAWSVAGLDEEVFRAGREYEPDSFLRHKDALETAVIYLADFAHRMPEWINLSTTNARVRKMCEELAAEIGKITFNPDETIARHGKLKSQLKAKLAVQTCWIYREETERNINEEDEAKRLRRLNPRPVNLHNNSKSNAVNRKLSLAQQIFQKVIGKAQQQDSDQPSLF
jgi:hypothetical protein